MQLRDIMTGSVETIHPGASLQECARVMREADVGAIPVCDGDRIAGIVTDRDIVVRAVAEGEDPAACRVSDVMTKDLTWCFDDEEVEHASRLMGDRQVRRLLILDRAKKLAGIISLADLAVRQGEERPKTRALEGVSAPS